MRKSQFFIWSYVQVRRASIRASVAFVRRALALLAVAIVVGGGAIVFADLDNQQRGGDGGVFVSQADSLGLVVPRGWHATDEATYPGLLLWMMRGAPDARMVLTADVFTRQVYCSWPITCRTTHDALAQKLACALRLKLAAQHMRVGPIEAGPKETEAAGLPTVWFEYDDGHHFFRQAVALTEDRVVSLLLSTSSAEGRTGYVRAFEQTLRTLHPLTEAEQAAAPQVAPPDAGLVPAPSDAAALDGGVLPDAAVAPVATATFHSAPASKVNPVGSCAQQ